MEYNASASEFQNFGKQNHERCPSFEHTEALHDTFNDHHDHLQVLHPYHRHLPALHHHSHGRPRHDHRHSQDRHQHPRQSLDPPAHIRGRRPAQVRLRQNRDRHAQGHEGLVLPLPVLDPPYSFLSQQIRSDPQFLLFYSIFAELSPEPRVIFDTVQLGLISIRVLCTAYKISEFPHIQSMENSVTLASLRVASPVSSPRGANSPMRISTSAVTMNSPSAVLSPRSPTCPSISYDQETAQNRFRGGSRIAAGRNNGGCATEERQELQLTSNKTRDHYSLLGVPRDASHEDVRHAYRRLALQYHPDVMPLHQLEMATKCFAAINEAYDTLSDPHKRKAYDALHPARSPLYAGAASGGSSAGRWRGRNWETDQCWC